MKKQATKNGVVSLVVCLFIMIIVSLIALSFAAIMRREQRQALDRQLNAEAFYAAETGINDALEAINNGLTANITSCDPAQQDLISTSTARQLDAVAGVSYSCVFINQTPAELNYDVPNGSAVRVPIHSAGPVIDTIKISWQDRANPTNIGTALFDSNADFLAASGGAPVWAAAWPGMLRIQLIPDTYPITRNTVATGTANLFAFPSQAGGSATFQVGGATPTADGSVVTGGCNTVHGDGRPLNCEITINNLTYSNNTMTLRGIYDTSQVIIRAFSGATPVQLKDSQTVIDSTGLANGLAKRVRVFVPITNNKYPGFALEAGDDICKRLQVAASVSVDATYNGVFACNPATPAP